MKRIRTSLLLFFLFVFHYTGVAQPCRDTSFRARYYSLGIDNFRTNFHCNISGNETLVLGYTNETVQKVYAGILFRININGDIRWSKQLTKDGERIFWTKTIELANSNIAAIGYRTQTSISDIIVLMLDKDGNFLWQKSYQSNSSFSPGGILFSNALTEGNNGDLLIAWNGMSFSQVPFTPDTAYAVVARLSNIGNPIWSKCFISNDGFLTNLSNIFNIQSGSIITTANIFDEVGCNGYSKLVAMKLNYTDGFLQLVKPYCYDDWQSNQSFGMSPPTDYLNSSIIKINNEIELFGTFFSFDNSSYLYRLVLSDQLSFKESKLYKVPRTGSMATTYAKIQVLKNGSIQISAASSSSNKKSYWCSIDSIGNTTRQRRVNYEFDTDYFSSRYNFGLKSTGITYTTNYKNGNTSFAEFNQFQNNDPGVEDCTGTDTSFISISTFGVTASNWQWKTIINNPVQSYTYSGIISDFPLSKELVCEQVSSCNSVKIYGADTVCVLGQEADFVARTNTGCNKRIEWRLNSAAYSSYKQLTDSTIRVAFQNFNGGGVQKTWIYAMAGDCGTVIDSFQVTLLPVPTALTKNNFNILCPGDTLKLTPGYWFKSYLWQNGSTDSVYKVTTPGLYKVRIEAYCGYILHDSVLITSPNLFLGNDREICKNDTIVLQAQNGFTNYNWQQSSNILLMSDTTVKVFPDSSTSYIVSATVFAGCTLRDTVFVKVNHSPPVMLGNDTSICKNSSIVLSAGVGFTKYQWSTGERSQSILVNNAGNYSVSAIYNNGCVSKDTFNIVTIYNLPQIGLNKSTVICKGQNDTLDAGRGFASYLWQDGTNNRKYYVTSPGQYSVQVTDTNNCINFDTTIIEKIEPLPSGFLGKDTSICIGNSIVLVPEKQFVNYWWSNGETSIVTRIFQAGFYHLTVKNIVGCIGKDSIVIADQKCKNSILFPSGFTPNTDGLNDDFKTTITGQLIKYELEVFNRNGGLIFRSNSPSKTWDGQFKGFLQPNGIYVFFCRYQFADDKEQLTKGTIVIIR